MQYSVYIIYSATLDKRYIGQTSDLNQRLLRHNAGYNKSTKLGAPWVLISWTNCESRSEAMRLEKKIKNLKSIKRQDDFMIKHGFTMQEVIGPEK
jgi:putative endonuclease